MLACGIVLLIGISGCGSSADSLIKDWIKYANEYADARLWAGIHFPSDVDTSRQMGAQLAAMALARDAG